MEVAFLVYPFQFTSYSFSSGEKVWLLKGNVYFAVTTKSKNTE